MAGTPSKEKKAPHPPRGSRRASPSPRFAGRGKETAARAAENAEVNSDPESETLDDDYEAFHKRKKTLPEAEAQMIEARFQATFAKQHEAHRRFVNDVFQFWIVCTHQACKRLSGCADDPYACHQRWWPVILERQKVRYRAYVAARADGRSADEALRHAEAEVKRLADHIARVEAEQFARLDALEAAERAQRGEAEAPAVPPVDAPAAASGGDEEGHAPRERQRGPRVSVL